MLLYITIIKTRGRTMNFKREPKRDRLRLMSRFVSSRRSETKAITIQFRLVLRAHMGPEPTFQTITQGFSFQSNF